MRGSRKLKALVSRPPMIMELVRDTVGKTYIVEEQALRTGCELPDSTNGVSFCS